MRYSTRTTVLLLSVFFLTGSVQAQQLFVGLSEDGLPAYSSDLVGFPDVVYEQDFYFNVNGAAADNEGNLYICNGPFTTYLYRSTLGGQPTLLATLSEDFWGLAWGRDTLWGYSNYAATKGIYSIDIHTGQATLAVDVYSASGFRFFGLGYNPVDDLLYGVTTFGSPTGLYSINIDTGEMLFVASGIPASNGQVTGIAVGNNTVYATGTRGDDDIPYYSYDLSQGAGGDWVGFTNPYPSHHSQGGAAWIPGEAGVDVAAPKRIQLGQNHPNPFNPVTMIPFALEHRQRIRLTVHDIAGREVAVLAERSFDAGPHKVTWRGLDDAGRVLNSGVYFLSLESEEGRETRQIVLLK